MLHQLIGVEVIVMAEDALHYQPPLLGETFLPLEEKLRKNARPGARGADRTERKALRGNFSRTLSSVA